MTQKELGCMMILNSFMWFWSEIVWNSELGQIVLLQDIKNTLIPAAEAWFSKYKLLHLEVELENEGKKYFSKRNS